MSQDDHYLKAELYDLVQEDSAIFEFLRSGSLDGIWYWDLENQAVEWMSPRFWETFGHDPATKQHLASEWQDMIDSDDLGVALDNFKKHSADPNHPYDQVVRYRHRDGSTIWVRCRGLAIRNDEGKPVRMLGAHTDVTALKRAEEAAAKANRAKSEFLANVSHEIRTPLNGVIGAAELLGDSELTLVQRDHLHVITESAEVLLAVIGDILDYSKIEAGKLDLEERPIRLRDLLGEVLKVIGSRLRDKPVELVSDIPVDVPDRIIGDPVRLRQVLINLVGNAIKSWASRSPQDWFGRWVVT